MYMTTRGQFVFSVCSLILLFGPASSRASSREIVPNARNYAANELGTDDQKMDEKDNEITRRIRQSLLEEKSLSVYAQNIKIITVNGRVTLKGFVRSLDEEAIIAKKAKAVAGSNRVKDELQVSAE